MKKDDQNAYTVKVEELPKSEVELVGSIPWEQFAAFEAAALANLGKNIEVDGFRKGSVPENILKKQVPEQLTLEEMAQLALEKHYPEMIIEHKIDAIGRPKIALTKLARGNDLEFRILVSVMPAITLPDYKKLAKDAAPVVPAEVTDEDVHKTIEELRHMRLHQHDDHASEGPHEHTEEELPVVDDAFAKSFGKFETVAELKDKIKENLKLEKELQAKDKRRAALLDAIANETALEVPALFVRAELEKMIGQLSFEIDRAGMKFDEYLEKAGKTKEQLETELTPDAEKRAKFQLVIDKIAEAEKLIPDEAAVQTEADRLLATYPGADEARTKAYAHLVLTNEKVMKFLETL